MDIEPLHASLALAAGEGLAVVRRSSNIDATVMASADARGDIVYTSDLADFRALHGHFQNVNRILKA